MEMSKKELWVVLTLKEEHEVWIKIFQIIYHDYIYHGILKKQSAADVSQYNTNTKKLGTRDTKGKIHDRNKLLYWYCYEPTEQ